MQEISWVGAVIGTFLSFVFGGFWYSRLALGVTWAKAAGLTEQQIESADPLKMVTLCLPMILVTSFVFAAFLGEASLLPATGAGFAAGLFWVSTSFGVTYVFEQRPLNLWLVNAGYQTIQFTIIGASIGIANVFF